MSLVIENNIISAEAIAARLRREISTLELEVGTRLRPLRELATRYDTSYITMRKAINMLCDEGLLTSRRGAGVYVCSDQDVVYLEKELTNKAVAMLFCGMEQHITTSPLYGKLLYGIEKEAALQGYNVVISHIRKPENFRQNDVYDSSCGFLGIGANLQGLKELFDDKPFVWMMGADKQWGDHFTYNNASIGRLAAKYALQGDFNSYACINVDPIVGTERFQAFVNCLKCEDKEVLAIEDYNALVISKFEQHTDRDLAAGWMERICKLKLPAVLFVASELSIDVIHKLLEAKGLKIGKDITIVAGNVPNSSKNDNYIGINLFAEEVGRLAINHLLWRFENPDSKRVVIKLEPEIECI